MIQPLQVSRTCVHFSISTRVLEGQSDPNFTRVHIVFETRPDPHGHGMFLVCWAVPATRSIFCKRSGCMYDIFFFCKVPCGIQHLTNLQLNLDDMLVT